VLAADAALAAQGSNGFVIRRRELGFSSGTHSICRFKSRDGDAGRLCGFGTPAAAGIGRTGGDHFLSPPWSFDAFCFSSKNILASIPLSSASKPLENLLPAVYERTDIARLCGPQLCRSLPHVGS
jgi:hypothetical protein